ncbi:hypothetical protein [Mycolicibacterium gilvum]|uniref:hypothetical protein n=1 Tax=Mycolicibacterium gilvum TaxID=1804 RepID=UPI00404617C4
MGGKDRPFRPGLWIVGAAVIIGVIATKCGGDDPLADKRTAEPSPPSTSRTISSGPDPHEVMNGDGYHKMGGIDGKNWGVWLTPRAPTECTWSIRLTSPYTGATILNEGHAPPGQGVRVSIQPPGDVSSISGEIDGGRVVFQTTGCGAWRLAS